MSVSAGAPAIEQLLVERYRLENEEDEELLAVAHAKTLGIPVVVTSRKHVARMAIDARTLCVGDVPFVRDALHAAGAVLPEHAPYPDVLKPYLRRETGWVQRFQHLRRMPVFVKPAEGWKRFTGCVIDYPEQRREFRISGNQSLWWSAPVQWVSEWRVYCALGEVLDVQRAAYTPVDGPMIDMPLVEKAVAEFAAAEDAPSGVALDFGVLSTGETALIEANDGFAFGAYGSVSGGHLWRIWAARWPELIARRKRADGPPRSPDMQGS